MSDILAEVRLSAMRVAVVVAILSLLIVLSLSLFLPEFFQTDALKGLLFLICGLALWQFYKRLPLARAALILTEEGLFDEEGKLICALSNIRSLDRSWLSFRPSNGFLLRLHTPVDWCWCPGVYWCAGHRIGVGGAVERAAAKAMADQLVILQGDVK